MDGQPQDQQQQYNPPPQMFPQLTGMENRQYSEAHYRFLTSLIESASARTFFEQIAATDFSHQCILEFHKVLTSGFDKNAILASNKKIEIRIIEFDLLLNFMVMPCHESDIQNPAFMTFQENIRQTFKDFVSRSQDAEERKRLLKSEYEVTQSPGQKKEEPSRFSIGRSGS